MSRRDARGDGPSDRGPSAGSRTGREGTAVAVDVSRDRRARVTLVMFVAGPVIWSVHFMLVYLVVEAGCSDAGPGLRLFGPPVPTLVTLAATVVAALACVVSAAWAYRRWRASHREQAADHATEGAGAPGDGLELTDWGGSLAFAGFLLSLLGLVTVLFVGLPALVLPSC